MITREQEVTRYARACKETELYVTKAIKTAYCVNSLVWQNKYLTQEAKRSVQKVTIMQITGYAAGCVIERNYTPQYIGFTRTEMSTVFIFP